MTEHQNPAGDNLQELSWMFFAALRRISHNLYLHSRALEKQYGLTIPQLNVLWAVASDERIPIGRVADRVSLSGATVTSVADRLEERDLVTRERSKGDKRRVLISLTRRGHELLQAGPQPLQRRFLDRMADLEQWQRTELLSAVQHVAAMMEPDQQIREKTAREEP